MRRTSVGSIVGKFAAAVPALLLAGAVLAMTTGPSSATKAIGKKTGKQCTSCHVESGEKELNDAGKKYKAANPD